MNIVANLNAKQQEAVTYEGTKLLILAGAGSGKTKVLTHRAAWFIEEKHVYPDNIVSLTFTNKAAKEMKERMSKLFEKLIVSPTGSVMAGTFHSFCVRLLRIDGKEIGIGPNFIIYDDSDQKELVKQILEDLNLPDDSYNPNSIMNEISNSKSQMVSALEYG